MKEEKPREEELLGVSRGFPLVITRVAHSGRRPNPKAVVSAMPTKVIARIAGIIVVAPFSLCLRLPEQGKQSVTAITFWRFSEKATHLGGPSRGRKPRPPSQRRG